MSGTINKMKVEMGLVDGTITFPAIYLKRIIGQHHYHLNRMEKA